MQTWEFYSRHLKPHIENTTTWLDYLHNLNDKRDDYEEN